MASRAAFLILRRRCREVSSLKENSGSVSVPFFSNGGFCRQLSSGASSADIVADYVEKDDLKSRIFRLRQPKRSVANVLQKWINEGNQINISELRQISKDLRKFQRYKHALEISEWMVTHDEFEVSVSDYAIRINLMTKVFGIDAAERYFEGLPLTAKTSETYTALLHSYAGAKLTEKAENLYERMKDSDLSLTALTYNEMMTMYISVGLVEKVSLVVEELKRQKVTPDIFTYNLWISSSAATMNVDEVRRILDEMSSDPGCDESWQRYINLANIYITTGHFTHGESNSLVSAEKGITQREWITYDFLIILHAGLGNRDRIDQIWKSLRMTNQKMTRRNYICILSSYLMLGNLKEVGEVIDQWRQSTSTAFDVAACGRLLNAFTDIGLTEKAKDFQLLLIEKKSDPADIQSSTTN
ncbi:pentatricopeptide repeat-containing protein At5g09450, mitochondrial isoform X1 [Humulus lupulus]|uniref:pentatricopeptide repeat-containing protein At5g09450, mitochondrial isoform X1 n=1 Tax=Humulus lupulus TaxID=3486 RepID=UPI002B410CF9|nr:pentatricopeptide repeat-containing protein At5g09450, mitochondrial isoform X1 [Humulus lupulus]